MFYKPPRKPWWKPFSDVISGNKEKDLHPWQQSESVAAQLIEQFCPEGGIVVDPFAGSGTTLAAAKRLGRQWLGFEVDPKTAAVARKRVKEA